MGVVYRAVDPAGRDVAIKLLKPELAADPTARQRLAREIDTMRRVRSPHVADVLDGDALAKRPYVVTRFIEGRQLDEVIAESGPLSMDALRRLAVGLARALAAIHEAGVVHRDLKPSNTMLVDGEPVVIDFGIAQAADSPSITQTGLVTGTPGYMAPEIFDDRPSSPASDVHAWAATVAFAATGRPPFGTGNLKAVIFNVMDGRAQLDGVPGPLVPLLRSALDLDPARRPSAAALADAVAALDNGAGDARTRFDRGPAPAMAPPAPAPAPPAAAPPAAPPGAAPLGVAPAATNSFTAPRETLGGNEPYPGRSGAKTGRNWALAAGAVLLGAVLIVGGFALRGAVSDGTTAARTLPPAGAPSGASPADSVHPSAPGAVSPRGPLDGPSSPSGQPATSGPPSHRKPSHAPAGTTPSRRPKPRPTTHQPSPTGSTRVVTAGAFCSPEGATGVTSAGTPMKCVRKDGEKQARWRSAA